MDAWKKAFKYNSTIQKEVQKIALREKGGSTKETVIKLYKI